ncbi:hypothetical protein P0D71_25725 [Paraburkholderia sp. RL17-383-BIF-A]|jgi:hypothetical protein|uniref:hypothetical protein n=1 Tax=Paraburkholderia sp. RL17-383-BIF-A TaxID=3031631 RepID=UPI0038BE03B5
MFQLIVKVDGFGVVHAKRGPRQKRFAAKPMLRIVNMQKRLRPVLSGLGAIDLAMDVRNLPRHDPPAGQVAAGRGTNSGYNYKLHSTAARHFFNVCRQS